MRTIILSDIHANIYAFRSVVKKISLEDRVIFLGDVANFGSHPAECVDLLRTLNPICIMGNHDRSIISDSPRHPWDQWAKKRLTKEQLRWIGTFHERYVLDGHILLIHGAENVPYDILPNTPDAEIAEVFKNNVEPGIDEVWFGHYHYGIDRKIGDVTYRCIRPVGQQRDHDNRAGFSIYESGSIKHERVSYDVDAEAEAILHVDFGEPNESKSFFVEFLKEGFHPVLMKKDIEQMHQNDKKKGTVG